jgi:hypothetical protein
MHFLVQFEMEWSAKTLERLHLPLTRLDQILRYDLFLILFTNLLSVTDEWGGFDESWLIDQLKRQRMLPPGLLKSVALSVAWLYMGWIVTSS